MKRHITTTLVMLMMLVVTMLAPSAFAQEGCRGCKRKVMSREQFEKRKTDYIIKQAELTKEETAKFIPILKRMNEKRRQYHEKIRDMVQVERDGQLKTDADYLKMIHELARCIEAEKSIEVQYLDSFLQVISAKKYYRYKQVQFKFLNRMMREHGRHREKVCKDCQEAPVRTHDSKKDAKGPHDSSEF